MRFLMLMIAFLLVGSAAAVTGGMLVADHLYGRAADRCEQLGGVPAAIEDRLTYECATPYGRVQP